VHQDLADAERHELARRSLCIVLRDLGRHSAEKARDGAPGTDTLRRFAKIRHGG